MESQKKKEKKIKEIYTYQKETGNWKPCTSFVQYLSTKIWMNEYAIFSFKMPYYVRTMKQPTLLSWFNLWTQAED